MKFDIFWLLFENHAELMNQSWLWMKRFWCQNFDWFDEFSQVKIKPKVSFFNFAIFQFLPKNQFLVQIMRYFGRILSILGAFWGFLGSEFWFIWRIFTVKIEPKVSFFNFSIEFLPKILILNNETFWANFEYFGYILRLFWVLFQQCFDLTWFWV